MTIINDMDLVIKKYRDKVRGITSEAKLDEICYIKVKIVKNDSFMNYTIHNMNTTLNSNHSTFIDSPNLNLTNNTNSINFNFLPIIHLNITNITNITNNYILNQNLTNFIHQNLTINKHRNLRRNLVSNKNLYKNMSENGKFTLLNKNLSNANITLISNETDKYIMYKLTDPGDKINQISDLILQYNNETRHSLCSKCLDNTKYIDVLYREVKSIKKEIKEFTNKTNTKQDIIVKFADYINRLNIVKINLNQLSGNQELLKKSNCSMYEKNNIVYQATVKSSGLLIEAIQDTIRKQNLNVNFIVIS